MAIGVAPHVSDHPFVVGRSPAMRAVARLIDDIAPTNIPIVISGESGSGKEMVALEFHRRSSRDFFSKYNYGNNGVPKEGNTTFFFDEVDQLDPRGQGALLEFLVECEMQPARSRNSRVIAATAGNLEQQMRNGHFDRRLYYLLHGVCLHLPPLRDREEDIPLLFDFFLERYATLYGLPIPQLDSAMMKQLLKYEWPGNVRELENFARKAVALQDLPLAFSEWPHPHKVESPGHDAMKATFRNAGSLKEAVREASRNVERALILKTLERMRWNRKRTALELQISYKALLYKLKQLGLEKSADSRIAAKETV